MTADEPQSILESLVQNEELCDRFEEVWLRGAVPSLMEFLRSVPAARHPDLLRQLLELDLVYRHQRGQPKSLDEYRAEFPNLSAVVEAVFAAVASQPTHSAVRLPMSADRSRRSAPSGTRGSVSVTARPINPHDRLGNYELLGELARGPMGVVFRARRRGASQLVAVKMMFAGRFTSPEDIERFCTNIEAAGQLDHPQIVPIYEVGVDQGVPFFSMELIDGPSLADRLRQSLLPQRESARILSAVADAISFAHSRGVLHGNIKPQNIVLTSHGEPRVTDFGLAPSIPQGTKAALGQGAAGLVYLAPEQVTGQPGQIGPASDIYSLGTTMYALLTGRPPFPGSNWQQVVKQVRDERPIPPRQLAPTLDRDLERVCLKSLQKSIAARYASAAELASDLRRFLTGQPVSARPQPWFRRWLGRSSR